MWCHDPDSFEYCQVESPSVKRLSESSQPWHSRFSFTSMTSNSQKRDSSIIHVDARAHDGDTNKISTEILNHVDRVHEQWRMILRRKLDGVPFTLASIVFTLMVRILDFHSRPSASHIVYACTCRFCTWIWLGLLFLLPLWTRTFWHLQSVPSLFSLVKLFFHPYVGQVIYLGKFGFVWLFFYQGSRVCELTSAL